jgi:predicted Zn-dependent peptidase
MPERETPEYYAMGVIDQILLQGKDSRLYQALVQRAGLTGDVSGGINLLGNMYDYEGPMLWMASLVHDKGVSADSIMKVIDGVIEPLGSAPVDQATLDRALVKIRSDLYDTLGGMFGFGRADLLASFALFDSDPARINRIEDQLRKVTPELIQKTAREYLRATNRTVLLIEPGAATTPADSAAAPHSDHGRGS